MAPDVETPRLWAVCSITINQYLKIQWATLNTHTDASGNLCASSLSVITCRNGWHEISGSCYECRSYWPRSMYWIQKWFLEFESFLKNALHIVDDRRREWWMTMHHLVRFFPRFVGGRMVSHTHGETMVLSIKSTRLVANANRPEGISAFPVSPYHTTQKPKPSTLSYTKPATVFYNPSTIL